MKEKNDAILTAVQEKLKKDYDFSDAEVIKIGTYSKVYRVHCRKPAEYHALKILDIDVIKREFIFSGNTKGFERVNERFKKKIAFFKEFRDQPNILNYVDDGSIDFEYEGCSLEMPYMLSKYIEGDTLAKVVKDKKGRLTPAQIFHISEKILQAIVRIHEKDIYYWLVDPRKILIQVTGNEKNPVLIYSALPVDPSSETELTGMKSNLNRELINTMSYFKQIGSTQKEVEIASVNSTFGLLLYEMVTGNVEIRKTSNFLDKLAEKLIKTELNTALLINGVLDIIAKTLEKDPGKRYRSVKELLDVMEDFRSTCLRELQ